MHNHMTEDVLKRAQEDDSKVADIRPEGRLVHPELNPEHYYEQVASDPYFRALIYLRHHIKAVSDAYFSREVDARNIDLFMMTSSVSSPSGPGSDSEPIPLQLGDLHTYLVDSSQFGFEPILVGGVPRAYCYLASMRGEDADVRHLNQFFHCEYEAQEALDEVITVAEGYVRSLVQVVDAMPNVIDRFSGDPARTRKQIAAVLEGESFQRITFDDAIKKLQESGGEGLFAESPHGFDLTSKGERKLLELLHATRPIWVTHYPRDRVPFYQKPLANKPDRVLNADLLCPAVVEGGFSGEFLGLGQRQDDVDEMYESMRRQGVDSAPYEWYVDLRRNPEYKTTSGFGLGIERFVSWIFGFDSIHKAILYPRMKGVPMNP